MKKVNNSNIRIDVAVFMGITWLMAVTALTVVAFKAMEIKPAHTQGDCYQQLAELDIVAHIATATGKAPGKPSTPRNTTFKVNPEACK